MNVTMLTVTLLLSVTQRSQVLSFDLLFEMFDKLFSHQGLPAQIKFDINTLNMCCVTKFLCMPSL